LNDWYAYSSRAVQRHNDEIHKQDNTPFERVFKQSFLFVRCWHNVT
jgi:hypothetical protein